MTAFWYELMSHVKGYHPRDRCCGPTYVYEIVATEMGDHNLIRWNLSPDICIIGVRRPC